MFPEAGLPCLGEMVRTTLAAGAPAGVVILRDAGQVNPLRNTLAVHHALKDRERLNGRARARDELGRLSRVLTRGPLWLPLWPVVAGSLRP